MKVLRIIAIALLVYVGIVVAFESLIGFFQPAGESTLVIITTDVSGDSNDRVLARVEHDGRIYVAANHWPRAWYRQALANPEVSVVLEDLEVDYSAVPVSGEEYDSVEAANRHPIGFKILTGFPPRYFLRLDPR
jgi:hypothetical protein